MTATKEQDIKSLDGPLIVGGEISDRQNILRSVKLIVIRRCGPYR